MKARTTMTLESQFYERLTLLLAINAIASLAIVASASRSASTISGKSVDFLSTWQKRR